MARFLRSLSDEVYATASAIVLVMDNLNIHSLSCLYDAFSPEEAHRLARRFEVHHTPKHGSWLNVAEILLSVLSRQCLDQRIESVERLEDLLAAWCASRKRGKVNWRFTTADARIKLRRLYLPFRRFGVLVLMPSLRRVSKRLPSCKPPSPAACTIAKALL